MTRIESRLKRLLAVYPEEWLREHHDELQATVLDLVEARGLKRLPLVMQADLLLGAWRARARADVAARGPLRAGWSLASLLCLVVATAAGLAWLREYYSVGMAPMLVSVGAASAVVYTLALTALPIALAASIGGRLRLAKWAAGFALACWLLVVFGVEFGLANHSWRQVGYINLLAWTALLTIGCTRAWSARPIGWPTGVAALAATAGVLGQLAVSATVPVSSLGYVTPSFGPIHLPYDRATMVLLAGWVLLAMFGLFLAAVDPRPAYAAALLLPIVGIIYFVPTVSTIGILGMALLLAAAALTVSRRTLPSRSSPQ